MAGSLPMSSAVTTSTCESAAFFSASDSASLSRMPTTVTAASSLTSDFFGWLAAAAAVLSCAYNAPETHRPVMMLAASNVLR
ncbi:hypothetical protein [Rhodanobacter lindaniclasticus]